MQDAITLSYHGLDLLIAWVYDLYHSFEPVSLLVTGADSIYMKLHVPFIATVLAAYRLRFEDSKYIRRRIYIGIFTWWIVWEGMPILLGVRNPVILEIAASQYRDIGTVYHKWSLISFGVLTLLVFLFGRRIFCANLCFGSLTNVAFAPLFRHRNPTGPIARALTKLVYPLVALYILFLLAAICNGLGIAAFDEVDGDGLTFNFIGLFIETWVLMIILIPIVGVRTCDRFICPLGMWYGLVSRIGRYRIRWRQDKCVSCELCTKVCNSSLPVYATLSTKGEMRSCRCNGCGECIARCPQGALEVRSGFRKSH